MLKSLRYRALIWFVLSTLLVSVLAFSLFHVFKSSQTKNQAVLESFEYFRYQFLKDQNQISGFLSTDIFKTTFYFTGESKYLNNHYTLISEIDSSFVNEYTRQASNYPNYRNSLMDIRNTYTRYCIEFDSLVYNLYKRGFKAFGLEGKLANNRFELEKNSEFSYPGLSRLKLIENEYLHLFDTSHISDLHIICTNLKSQVAGNHKISSQKKVYLSDLLDDYQQTFNQIVILDKKLGLSSDNGLKQSVERSGAELDALIASSIQETKKAFEVQKARINTFFGLSAFLLISLSIALSIYTSKYLVVHLEKLTEYLSSLTKTNFSQKFNIDLHHSSSEIRQIYKETRNMLSELRIREKQRDQALRQAEDNQQRYRDLADLLPQSIYETDRMGNLTYVNEAWFNTFGYSKVDVDEGVNLIEILNSAGKNKLLSNAKIENNDFIAIKKDGSKFPATVYSDVIKKGVRVIGRRGIIIDSTLRHKYIESLKKETKRAITSDKHKSSFLANMSHELRTPMNSIIGFTNMLSSKEIPADQKANFIDHIQSSSEMLLNLVDDIIDIAKIEAGQLKINTGECSPKRLVSRLTENFEAYKNRIEKEHIRLKLNLPKDELPVKTDEFRLKQILTNLISNAVKFTEEGQVEIGLKLKGQRMLEFYIQDTGIGMSKEELTTIFDRFTRSKLSEEKKISGTGLGLAISKNLVEMLGGNMWVSSEMGVGTKFSFTLPYIRPVNNTVGFKKTTSPSQNYIWENTTILIAEDDDNAFTYLTHILEKTKAKLIRANNGIEAVEAVNFHKNNIDVVLMDLRMPELNGLEAARRIKKNFAGVSIIAQTAFAMEDDRSKCIEAGCDDYITKPINPENLLAKITQFISQKSEKTFIKDVSSKAQKEQINIHQSSTNT